MIMIAVILSEAQRSRRIPLLHETTPMHCFAPLGMTN